MEGSAQLGTPVYQFLPFYDHRLIGSTLHEITMVRRRMEYYKFVYIKVLTTLEYCQLQSLTKLCYECRIRRERCLPSLQRRSTTMAQAQGFVLSGKTKCMGEAFIVNRK